MTSRMFLLRWWPALYSMAWITWAIIAPKPWLLNSHGTAHTFAALGAAGLLLMALFPRFVWVRFVGSLTAISYPLYRALSIAVEGDQDLSQTREVFAISLSLLIVLSILVMYPTLWWIIRQQELKDEE